MAIRVHPSAAVIGATVSGIDLAEPIAASSGQQLRDALDAHGVLVFRDQHSVDDDAQVRLAEVWGPVRPSPWEAYNGGEQLISRVYAGADYPLPTGLDREFHVDRSFTEEIADVAVLRPIVIPPCGGATTWADARAALRHLSPALLDEIRGLRAHHHPGDSFGRRMISNYGEEAGGAVVRLHGEGSSHPVVIVHPRSGDEVLFVSPRFTRYVIGLSRSDSDDLLARLYATLERPELQFSHDWRIGDVVVWDEHRLAHRAPSDYAPHSREVRRCSGGRRRPIPASA